MRQKLCKNLLSVLIALCMICGIAVPISETISSDAVYAAGYGTVNAKATTCKIAATGGGNFVIQQNTATITFKMDKNCQVRVYVMDTDGTAIWYKDVSGVKANKKYTVKWNGKNKNGKYVSISGSYKKYRVCIRAGSTKTYSSYIKLFNFAGGKGSKDDPYQVETVEQLAKIGKYADKYFKQVADIDFEGKQVDIIQKTFTGNYDGNGYAIKNAAFTGDTAAAMFYKIGKKGVVQNVIFDGCTAAPSDKMAIAAVYNNGLIYGCEFKNTSVDGGSKKGTVAATICTTNNESGRIVDCVLSGSCKVAVYMEAGGVVYSNYGTIDSITGGNINVTAEWIGFIGGLVHSNYLSGVIQNCKVTGILSGSCVGGLARSNAGLIESCTFIGEAHYGDYYYKYHYKDVYTNVGTVRN